MVWSWMCQPSHGNRFFGFKNEDYKRKYLKTMQATYNEIQDEKFLCYLPKARPKDEAFEGPKDLMKSYDDSHQVRGNLSLEDEMIRK